MTDNMEDTMAKRRTATEIVAPVTETVEVDVTPKPKTLSDETIVGALKETIDELAGLMTLAKSRNLDVTFNLAPVADKPNTFAPANFSVKKDITNG